MAPAPSTLTKPVRDAYEDVARNANNLLKSVTGDLSRFRFVCPEFGDGSSAETKPNPRGTVRGVWRQSSGQRLVIPLIGVVDAANSKLGSYGNLDKSMDPTLKKLKACKFIVALKFPDFTADHPDVDFAEGVINQMARLSDMQKIVNTRVMEATRYNNAVRFADNNGNVTGSMVTTLGLVFTPVSKETTAEEFLKRSPTKARPAATSAPVPNVVDDPKYYTQCIEGANALKHNDQLPIHFLDGARVGRTGSELSRELTDGRWVRADCELIVWNMTDDVSTVRTFQLAVDKMLVLPRQPTASILEGSKGLEGKGLVRAQGEKKSEKTEANKAGTDDADGTDNTLSSGSDDGDRNNKRDRDESDGEHDGKKAKLS
ncbi:hypothetical protein AURDEDRAFT_173806 [Auricularia subglabra TFB-10046 SS5]|nr:hypothetical protein AURDEDRAFT_173806 [Auricularia subglabra TFB-10046 SS5]